MRRSLAVGLLWMGGHSVALAEEPAEQALLRSEPSEVQGNTELVWGHAEQLGILSGPGLAGQVRLVAADQPAMLTPEQMLLVAARTGDVVEVACEECQLGLGSGAAWSAAPLSPGGVEASRVSPAAVTWQAARRGKQVLRVPTWGSSRFVVVRNRTAQPISARIARPVWDARAAARTDLQVAAWLGSGQLPRPSVRDSREQLLLSELQAMREVLDRSHVAAELGRVRAATIGNWLLARWLMNVDAVRPLSAPYFIATDVQVAGHGVARDDDAEQWIALKAGERLAAHAPDADVVTVLWSSARGRSAELSLQHEGHELRGVAAGSGSVAASPALHEGAETWSPPRAQRIAIRGPGAVEVLALTGSVRVLIRAYQAQQPLLARQARPARKLLADSLAMLKARSEQSDDILALLVQSDVQRSAEQAVRLAAAIKRTTDPALRSVVRSAALTDAQPAADRWQALDDFWADSAALPPVGRGALRSAVLWRLSETWDIPALRKLQASGVAERRARWLSGLAELPETQASLLSALIDLWVPPQDATRSPMAVHWESRAARQGSADFENDLARAVWRGATPWSNVAPLAGAASELLWRQPEPDVPGQLCALQGPAGDRFTVLTSTPQVIAVAPEIGSHARVRVHALPADPESKQLNADSVVSVAGQNFSVLPLAGFGSSVAVRAGEHTWRVNQGPAVVAAIARRGMAPCATLREPQRWTRLSSPTEFPIPAGTVPTVASILVDPGAYSGKVNSAEPLKLLVDFGERETEVWLAAQAGSSAEVAVPATATRLRLRATWPVRVRVRLRKHAEPPRPTTAAAVAAAAAVDATVDASVGSATDPASARAAGGAVLPAVPPADEESLSRLRALSKRIRDAKDSAALDQARSERAHLLAILGYRRFADLDWSRLSQSSTPSTTTEAASPAAAQPGVPRATWPPGLPSNELWLPAETAAALPIDRVAKLPALPDDLSPADLEHSYAALLAGHADEALRRLEAAGAEQGWGRGALALALLLEAGQPERASALYRKLAQRWSQPGLWERAALSYRAYAAQRADVHLADGAHRLARLAIEHGASPDLLAPFGTNVRWESPELNALGAGSASVDQLGDPSEQIPFGAQLRAALLDLPLGARWLNDQTQVNLTELVGQTLHVTSACFRLRPGAEACAAGLEVDSKPLDCSEALPPTAAAGRGGGAGVQQCAFRVPTGARRLRWRLPAEPVLSWGLVQRSGEGERVTVAPRLAYARVTRAAPVVLDVAGPAVLRIHARSASGPASLKVRIAALGAAAQAQATAWQLELPTGAAPQARLVELDGEVGAEVSRTSVLDLPGAYRVEIQTEAPLVLVRPEVGRVLTPLEVSLSAPAPSTPRPASAPNSAAALQDEGFGAPRVSEPAPLALATWSLALGVEQADVADSDEQLGDTRLQASVAARKQWLEERAWARVSLLQRWRASAPSSGLEAYAALSASEQSPGVFLRARAVTQNIESTQALGYYATLGVAQRFELSARNVLLPALLATARHSDDSADQNSATRRVADPDVYSSYASKHPWSWEAALTLAQRPAVDTLLRSSISARLDPDFAQLDKLQLSHEAQWLGGDGWTPWLGWETSLAYYAEGPLRRTGFVRVASSPVAVFWHWLGNGDRLRAKFGAGAIWDEPSSDMVEPSVFAAFSVGYDFCGAQGLQDFTPLERPNRSRLEEGSTRRILQPPTQEHSWSREVTP